MRSHRSIAAIVVASFLVGLCPGIARADTEAAPNSAASPTTIRASVDRAAARLATQPSVDTRNQRAASAAQAVPMGGGGGKGMLIVSLVTTVVGLAATYYVLKEMQKQTDQAAKQ
jgi:hypothetical protein